MSNANERPQINMEYSAESHDTTAWDGYIGEIVPNRDMVLASLGGDLRQYAALMKDHQVKSLMQQRRDALIGYEWEVVPGGTGRRDKQAAESLKAMLSALRWDDATRKMLMAIMLGYAVAECLWAKDGREVILDDLKVRKAWRFVFGREGELRLRHTYLATTVMPERKFWAVCYGADDDDSPYGLGLGHNLWWPVFLKRNGAKFWASFLDRFGAPSTKATYPANATDEQKRVAMNAAKALRSMSVTAFPEGFDVQLVEATGSGRGSFESFMRYWDDAVAKLILGQSGTSTIGQYAGTANVHQQVRLDIIKSDGDLLCESFNTGPARWLTDWNYPGAAYPKVWRTVDDPNRQQAELDRCKQLWALGLEPTDEHVQDLGGGKWQRRKAEPGHALQFAEETGGTDGQGMQDDVDVLAGQLDALSGDAMTHMISLIRALANEVDTLEELRDRLLERYAAMNPADVGELIAGALSASYLQGMDAQKG